MIKRESENADQLERNEVVNLTSTSNELQNVEDESEMEIEKQNDSSKQKEDSTLKDKASKLEIAPEVEETETNANKTVNKINVKHSLISEKQVHENQGTETLTRVMRSQVKMVKSPEVIR